MRSCNADGEYGRGDPNEGTAKKKVAEEEEEAEEEEALSTGEGGERRRRRRGYEFRKGGPPARAETDRSIRTPATFFVVHGQRAEEHGEKPERETVGHENGTVGEGEGERGRRGRAKENRTGAKEETRWRLLPPVARESASRRERTSRKPKWEEKLEEEVGGREGGR